MHHRWARARLVALLWLAACGGGGSSVLDPCAAVGVCATPPADSCPSATRSLHYPATGTCAAVAGAAQCDYLPVLVDCTLTSQVCQAGTCVAPPDPCAAAGLCTSPPPDACASATLRLAYPTPGTCTPSGGAPACAYPPALVDCALGGQVCEAGACVAPPDPCAAAGVCTAPPAPGCSSATTRVTYPAQGACTVASGAVQCSYPPAATDCAALGQVCQAGACVTPDPCAAGDACTSPPPDTCASPTEALRYPASGTCTSSGGTARCGYTPTTVDCAAAGRICQGGLCVAPLDPCAAAGACTTPPADACASATLRLAYSSPGGCTASGGAATCSYLAAQVDCAASGRICQLGACVAPPDPCAAAGVCSAPPADACASTTTLLRYPAQGTCTAVGGAASCDYPPTQATCPAGQVCAGGACVADPCALPPDGAGFLAYAAWVSGSAGYDLRAMRTDGTCDQPLAGGPGDDLEPAWHARTGRIAWGGTPSGLGRIEVLELASGARQVLATGLDQASSPAWNPAGTHLVFEDRVLSGNNADLRFIQLGTGGTGALFASASLMEAGPAFSADGTQVYYAGTDLAGRLWIYRGSLAGVRDATFALDVNGRTLPDGTRADFLIGRPALSADGRWLAFTRAASSASATSASRVVLYDLQARQERVLSDQGDSEPAFPASGAVVALRTTRYGFTDLVLLDVTTGALVRRLTDGTRLVGTPAFPR